MRTFVLSALLALGLAGPATAAERTDLVPKVPNERFASMAIVHVATDPAGDQNLTEIQLGDAVHIQQPHGGSPSRCQTADVAANDVDDEVSFPGVQTRIEQVDAPVENALLRFRMVREGG